MVFPARFPRAEKGYCYEVILFALESQTAAVLLK